VPDPVDVADDDQRDIADRGLRARGRPTSVSFVVERTTWAPMGWRSS
jgi:hypothetical protein